MWNEKQIVFILNINVCYKQQLRLNNKYFRRFCVCINLNIHFLFCGTPTFAEPPEHWMYESWACVCMFAEPPTLLNSKCFMLLLSTTRWRPLNRMNTFWRRKISEIAINSDLWRKKTTGATLSPTDNRKKLQTLPVASSQSPKYWNHRHPSFRFCFFVSFLSVKFSLNIFVYRFLLYLCYDNFYF